ncbi:hypothetical protein R6Q59_010195 [Mikania micrantha]
MASILTKQKYPARAHCQRVAAYLAAQGLNKASVIFLEAQKTTMREDDDQSVPFRQRRPFFYLSGCKLPDAYLTYNIPEDYLTLFIPPIDPDSVIWAGLPESKEEAFEKYDVDQVMYTDEINPHLATFSTLKTSTIFLIPEQVSEHIEFFPLMGRNLCALRHAIDECRVVKDEYEIELIRKANQISTLAHIEAQKAARHAENEQELYGAFIGTCISNGAHEQAYHSICASGTSCSTLHYTRNDSPLQSRLNVLLDAGAEYNGYCADVTRTFPLTGQFTPESQTIYNIVKSMQDEAFKILKAGVQWETVHELTHRVAVRGLLKAGILIGDEEHIMKKRISVAFYPHGLGHYLGMDTHDTGGHPNYDDKDTMFKFLRVRGQVPAGAVITVEPGIYFCHFILDPVLKDPSLSKYINRKVLDQYWDVGGVRIEDDVVIRQDGYENLTDTPKL